MIRRAVLYMMILALFACAAPAASVKNSPADVPPAPDQAVIPPSSNAPPDDSAAADALREAEESYKKAKEAFVRQDYEEALRLMHRVELFWFSRNQAFPGGFEEFRVAVLEANLKLSLNEVRQYVAGGRDFDAKNNLVVVWSLYSQLREYAPERAADWEAYYREIDPLETDVYILALNKALKRADENMRAGHAYFAECDIISAQSYVRALLYKLSRSTAQKDLIKKIIKKSMPGLNALAGNVDSAKLDECTRQIERYLNHEVKVEGREPIVDWMIADALFNQIKYLCGVLGRPLPAKYPEWQQKLDAMRDELAPPDVKALQKKLDELRELYRRQTEQPKQ